MRLAVLADLHANRPAVTAVLEALADADADQVAVLGDLVGYNAEPGAVVATIAAAHAARPERWHVVAGNHDRDVLTRRPLPGTAHHPRLVQEWTARQLDAPARAYLAALPPIVRTTAWVGVHGSYLSDVFVTGYVTSSVLDDNLRAIAARPGWPRVALCGHSHQPMIAWWRRGEVAEPRWTDEVEWPADAEVVLINPGSVGQPRDGDPRAAFAVVDLDARRATLRRVAYDVTAAVAAIRAAGLPDELAARLEEAR